MPRYSIDYLNARREAKAASGGTTYGPAKRNAVDERAQMTGMCPFEVIGLAAHRVFDDIRKRNNEFRNQLRAGRDALAEIPF